MNFNELKIHIKEILYNLFSNINIEKSIYIYKNTKALTEKF